MADYARPEVLVGTQWVADHLKDPNVRVIEVSVDQAAFDQGHVPGAVALNWFLDLEERPHRDIASRATIEGLLGAAGVIPLGPAWAATARADELRAASPLETFQSVERFIAWIEAHVEPRRS